MTEVELAAVITALQHGKVIAYPTEAVFGIGCDPDNIDAIATMLQVKQREKTKGLILVAADYQQLLPYIDDEKLSTEQRDRMLQSWPGPLTWVVPARQHVSDWLTGQFQSIAVRVSDHPTVRQLCLAFGKPLTSTSANVSGEPACRDRQQVWAQLGDHVDVIIDEPVGGRLNPSEIRDVFTGHIFRAG